MEPDSIDRRSERFTPLPPFCLLPLAFPLLPFVFALPSALVTAAAKLYKEQARLVSFLIH
jgi:hypothetical protein